MLWILRYEALGVQSRQNRVALASPRFLILRVGRSGDRHQQRKVGCSPRCFRGRPAVHLDVLVSAVVGVAVLRFELRRLGQSVGDGREGILPQSRIDVLLPDVLGDGSARCCRSTALEWYLVRHEIRGGGRNQNPNEAVSPNIRKRLLRVICHHRPSVHQGGAERSPPDARPNASPGRSPCDATRPRTGSLGKRRRFVLPEEADYARSLSASDLSLHVCVYMQYITRGSGPPRERQPEILIGGWDSSPDAKCRLWTCHDRQLFDRPEAGPFAPADLGGLDREPQSRPACEQRLQGT